MSRHLVPPPSSITGALGAWLLDVHRYLESQPTFSVASFAPTETPNSRVTGRGGDLCVNEGSASTASRLWLLGGERSALTNQGWALVRIVQV